MEGREALTHYRSCWDAPPLATYEFRALPIEEMRSALTRTPGKLFFGGDMEVARGWSLRPRGTSPCRNFSRVGMVEERASPGSQDP